MISLLKAIEKGVQWTKLGVHNCILSLFTCFLRLHVCFLSLLVSILVCWLPFLFISWVWWSMHITSKKQAKRALIIILWSLSLLWGPFFPSLSFRIMSSHFPRLRFFSCILPWTAPSGFGYVYIYALHVDKSCACYVCCKSSHAFQMMDITS